MSENVKIWSAIVIFTIVITFTAENLREFIVSNSSNNYDKTSKETREEQINRIMQKFEKRDELRSLKILADKKEIETTSYAIRSKNVVFVNDRFFQDFGDKNLNWLKSNEYCNNLTLHDSSNWYLPSEIEFSNSFVFSQLNILLKKTNRNNNHYWTSTTYTKDGLDTSAITANSHVWSKSKKLSVMCATKDNLLNTNDEIVRYNDLIPKKQHGSSMGSNKVISKDLKSNIKRCTDKNWGWRFNSKDEVVCTRYRI